MALAASLYSYSSTQVTNRKFTKITFLSLSKHKANTTELTQSKANLFMLILKQGYIGIERYHAETQQRTK